MQIIWIVLIILNVYFAFTQFKADKLFLAAISAVAAALCAANLFV